LTPLSISEKAVKRVVLVKKIAKNDALRCEVNALKSEIETKLAESVVKQTD